MNINIKKTIKIVLVILTLHVIIFWYGKLNYTYEVEEVIKEKNEISYETAKKILTGPVWVSKKYYYDLIKVKLYSRTMVPFKYKNTDVKTKKKYYYVKK